MIFCMKVDIQVFHKLIVLFLMVIARNTQNSIFVISSQYLRKEGRDEVDFLHAHKQISNFPNLVPSPNLGGHGQE